MEEGATADRRLAKMGAAEVPKQSRAVRGRAPTFSPESLVISVKSENAAVSALFCL